MAKTYTAPHKVYQDGILVEPGTPFTTDAPKGKEWVEEKAEKPKVDKSAE
jgi:hypothetical protein